MIGRQFQNVKYWNFVQYLKSLIVVGHDRNNVSFCSWAPTIPESGQILGTTPPGDDGDKLIQKEDLFDDRISKTHGFRLRRYTRGDAPWWLWRFRSNRGGPEFRIDFWYIVRSSIFRDVFRGGRLRGLSE